MRLPWLPLLLVLGFTSHAAENPPQAQSLPIFEFPEPPQQHTRWEARTNVISGEFASATATLFEQALADPRGCEYRNIEIYIDDVWNGSHGRIMAHGWVLPETTNSHQTFAVCWNGLVYPVISVGGPAHLEADMESLVASATTNPSQMRMALYGRAISEKMSVSEGTPWPVKACLLSRLGESNLAARVWDAVESVSTANLHNYTDDKDPYLMIAGDWAWSLFDRMICAHGRGDLTLALVSARKLAAAQPQIEATARQRGFPPPGSYGVRTPTPQARPYLSFLGQLPQILSNLERRAREPKKNNETVTAITNTTKRIAALVDELDLVNARQNSQPGRVLMEEDPIVQALIKEGNPAVEPLLRCWESDQRLTCSVGFGRSFFRDRHVLPVTRAAKAALQGILLTEFPNAAEARQFWNRYKGLSPEERWFQVLREESVMTERSVQVMPAGGQPRTEKMQVFGQGQWMEAARMIVQPTTISGFPASGFYSSNALPPGESVKIRGESLRSKRNPSVTELLVTNASLIAEHVEHLDQVHGIYAIQAGAELAGIINQWDKPAAVAPAQRLMRRAVALWPDQTTFITSGGHELARYIPQLTEFRVAGGETNALDEYAAWIKSADQEKLDGYSIEAFEPLWRHPAHPAVVTVSEWLFNDASSPWSKSLWQRFGFDSPLQSGLVQLPAFRKLLARELDKREVVGSMEYPRPGMIGYHFTNNGGGTQGFELPAADQPAIGTTVEIRQCDWIAFSLYSSKNISFFNPFAPVEKRNEAIAKAKAELLRSK